VSKTYINNHMSKMGLRKCMKLQTRSKVEVISTRISHKVKVVFQESLIMITNQTVKATRQTVMVTGNKSKVILRGSLMQPKITNQTVKATGQKVKVTRHKESLMEPKITNQKVKLTDHKVKDIMLDIARRESLTEATTHKAKVTEVRVLEVKVTEVKVTM
jgi:hypothetical protein